ncbi:MAG TPA: A24 family peptidase [Acidimicrobiales bacterium]
MNADPFVCAVLGLPVGWFSGVLIDRVPDRLPLRPLPGVRLRGVYLVVQVAMVVLFGLVGWRFWREPPLFIAGYLLLTAMLLTVSVIDITLYRLPDRIVLPTLGASLVIIVAESLRASEPSQIKYALVGALIYFGFLLVVHLISPAGMGFGDVKLAAVMGLYLGWLAPSYQGAFAMVLWGMLVGFVSGSVVGIVMLVTRRRSTPIPFGPFLALGALTVVLIGQHLVSVTLAA